MTSGRQRSREADAAILSATLDLLRSEGYRGLTMLAVIERAGVSSATLYRRWPDKHALVSAALGSLVTTFDPVDTGSFAGDLEALARHIAKSVVDREDLGVLATEVQQDEELRALSRAVFTEPRLAQIGVAIDQAVARGELPKRVPADVVHSLLGGPIYHRAVLLDGKLTPQFLKAVVRGVLGALAA